MQKTKNPLVFIFITVLIDSIGVRIIFPVVASVVTEISHMSINKAITFNGYMMTCYAIMQFTFSPILGGLGDRFGRRPVLLLSLVGVGIDYLFLSLSNTLPLLFLGKIISGISGSSLTTGFAYTADISPPEKRAQNFGIIGAAIGFGFIIGPFIGGLLSEFGTRVPFIVAAYLSLLNLIFSFFILPESLKKEDRREFSLRRANIFGTFMQLRKNKDIRMLLVVMFFLYLAGQVLPAVWPFYTKYLYKWSDREIGYSLAFMGVTVAIVKGGLVEWTQKKLGSIYSIYVGLLLCVAGLSLLALVCQSWIAYVFILVYCLGGVASPSLQGIISGRIPPDEQGELQGIMTTLISLSTIISPLIMTNLFYFFTKENGSVYFPGAPFAAAAIIIFIGFLLCVKKLRKKS